MDRMVEVYAARDLIEAHFLKDLLAGSGIEAQVVDENSCYAGTIGLAQPRVWVFEHNQERSRELLLEYETREKEE